MRTHVVLEGLYTLDNDYPHHTFGKRLSIHHFGYIDYPATVEHDFPVWFSALPVLPRHFLFYFMDYMA